MKLYISGDDTSKESFSSFNIVDNFEDSEVILILPGGLGSFYDLFRAIESNKKIILYNKDFFYTPIIKKLYELYEDGIESRGPSEYMYIESEINEIIKKLEEM